MREVFEVKPGASVYFHGSIIKNDTTWKSIYVRVGPKSVTVSDRKPANYGVKRDG